MEFKIIGNDLEFGGQKVARLFDVNASTRQRLDAAMERLNIIDEEMEDAYEKGYKDGRSEELNKSKP